MRNTSFVVALVVSVGLGLAQIGVAQTAPPPTILNVTMDAAGDQLTISGTGFGPAPVVTIDGQPVTVLLGSTDTQVTVITPAVLLTTPGSYRLTVVDSVRQVGEVFVVASHARIVAPVGATPSETPNAASGGATRLAAPPATEVAGPPAPQPSAGIGPLVVEDAGAPFRTALGFGALSSNTTGWYNTASGYRALSANTTGFYNTASGFGALSANTIASYNTANGFQALNFNTTGRENTAFGSLSLFSNTTGSYNTASGFEALLSNTTGFQNTASGLYALLSNTTGADNTASGLYALQLNTTGSFNTASGYAALESNTTGADNTAFGTNAGSNATTGSYNVFLGAGVLGTAADTNTIRMGLPYDGTNGQNQTFIAGIYGTPVTNWLPVVIDATGKLGTVNPQTGGGMPVPTASTRTPTNAMDAAVARLQQQVRDQQQQLHDQQTMNADLRARLARLESLLSGAAAAGGK